MMIGEAGIERKKKIARIKTLSIGDIDLEMMFN